MKKRVYLLASFIMLGILFSACSSSKNLSDVDTGDIPKWYLTPPTSDNYIYAPATATSRDMELAVNKAETEARGKIGRQMEVKVKSMQKKFEEEVGEAESSQLLQQFTQVTKTVVSTELTGSTVKEKKIVKDGDNWRVYVLMQYPIGDAQKAFLTNLSKNKELYTRYRSTQAFKELDDEVKKYEEWKKNQ